MTKYVENLDPMKFDDGSYDQINFADLKQFHLYKNGKEWVVQTRSKDGTLMTHENSDGVAIDFGSIISGLDVAVDKEIENVRCRFSALTLPLSKIFQPVPIFKSNNGECTTKAIIGNLQVQPMMEPQNLIFSARYRFDDNSPITEICTNGGAGSSTFLSNSAYPQSTGKDTNPKTAAGDTKVPLHLFPSTAMAAGAVAFHEGAVKYGRQNWRKAGVRYSVYQAAVLRHLMSAWEGETIDPTCGIDHLGKALACIAILIDARAAGTLTDDRAVEGGYEDLINILTPEVVKLTELHKDKNPYHYTIADNGLPEIGKRVAQGTAPYID